MTTGAGHVRQVVVGVSEDNTGNMFLLTDEEVLDQFNQRKPDQPEADDGEHPVAVTNVPEG